MRWFRSGLSVSAPFVWRCLNSLSLLRFHIPLIEPDVRISRIRLSDGRRLQAHATHAFKATSPEGQACSGIARSFFGGHRLAPLSRPLFPSPTSAAFPEIQAGRLPHCPFRGLPTTKSLVGLLSVHSHYGLHTRRVALRPSTPEASAISLPTSPLRLLPTCLPSFRPVCRLPRLLQQAGTGRRRQAGATLVGWDSRPLKFHAFPRRTE